MTKVTSYFVNAEIGGDALATAVETEAGRASIGIIFLQIKKSFFATVTGLAFHVHLAQTETKTQY